MYLMKDFELFALFFYPNFGILSYMWNLKLVLQSIFLMDYMIIILQ